MKRHFIIVLIFCFPFFAQGQSQNGLHFQELPNWKNALDLARKNGRYIFVDFYATWCGPCKKMDADVYPLTSIGRASNEWFISIKIQQDRTPKDSQQIKSWYKDADSLSNTFKVEALPTLLFFSPDGRLIGRSVGYQEPDSLKALFDKVRSMKQSDWDSEKDRQKEDEFYDDISQLAIKAQKLNHLGIADSIANVYVRQYLFCLSDSSLFTKKNINFISGFPEIIQLDDRFFDFFFRQKLLADKFMGGGFADSFVKSIVLKRLVEPILFGNRHTSLSGPDWDQLKTNLRKRFNENIADMFTDTAFQIYYYARVKDWKHYAQLINDAIQKDPPRANGHTFADKTMTGLIFQRDDWNLNTSAWLVFERCNDCIVLNDALKWSNLSIKIGALDCIDQYYDTKANLLYKLGEKAEAIVAEQHAYKIVVENARKEGKVAGGQVYLETIENMKNGALPVIK